MSQVLEVINLARFGAVSSEQAVRLYQQFSLLLAVLEHNGSVLAFLRNHYHEEFKYVRLNMYTDCGGCFVLGV